jgi:uncharacterized protein (DUF305 family)
VAGLAGLQRILLCAACALTLPGAAADDGTGAHAHHATPASDAGAMRHPAGFERFVREMDRDMQKMMANMHRPGYTGDADVDFLAMMIPHHQGAVDMARLVLIHGKDPLTRRLAEEIIASQNAEIAAMRARLEILRRAPDADPGGFPALHGTRGPGE